MTKEELIEKIRTANQAYRDGNPIMSDFDFDQLEQQLRLLDPTNPILTKIQDDFGVEEDLTISMGSQSKAMSLDELKTFYNRIPKDSTYNVSEKLDGASIELTYKNGCLIRALTRGDGIKGVNITHIISQVPNIPCRLSENLNLVVRGEILLTKTNMTKLNIELVNEGREAYTSVRNGAVALLKTLLNFKYAHYLTFKAFDLMELNTHA